MLCRTSVRRVCYAVSRDPEGSTSKKPPIHILCSKKGIFLKRLCHCQSMSDSISYHTSPLKHHQNFCLSMSPNPFSKPFFPRELVVRYILLHTARTKSVVHHCFMYGSPCTGSQVFLCFPWSVQVRLLFLTTSVL